MAMSEETPLGHLQALSSCLLEIQVRDHVEACRACREFYDGYRERGVI